MKLFKLFSKEPERRSYDLEEEILFQRHGKYYLGNIDDALKVNAVRSCINIIAGNIARLPLVLYVKTKNGREKATEHPLFEIGKNPNPDMTGISFMTALVTNLLLYGNAFAEIVKTNKKVHLNLLPSRYVDIKIDNSGNVSYVYNNPRIRGSHIELTKKNCLHIVGESLNGIEGLSPVRLLGDTIKFAKILEQYGNAYFENGATPSGTLNMPISKHLTDETALKLRKQFREKHTGVENTGSVIVLEDGTTYTPIQTSNDQSQFLQTKDAQIEEIARIFNVPLHMLQKTDKATSWGSGIEQMSMLFVRDTLGVHLRRIEQAFNKTLLSNADKQNYYFEFNTDAMLRNDTEGRYRTYEIGERIGILSPNEIRQKENLPAIEGGDVFTLQLNQPPYAGADLEKYNKNLKGGEDNGDSIQSNSD